MKKLTRGDCKRCIKPFQYFHGRGRLRIYCEHCRWLEMRDTMWFQVAQRKAAKEAERASLNSERAASTTATG